jgi:hypothetical protein
VINLPLALLWDLKGQLDKGQDGVFEALEAMEALIVEIQPWVTMDDYSAMGFSEDDTLGEHVFRMREAVIELNAKMTHLAAEYLGISNDDIGELQRLIEPVIVALALLYYVKYGIGDVIEDLMVEGRADFENGGYSSYVLKMEREQVGRLAGIVMKAFEVYKPYLPEYFLGDDELAALHDNLSSGQFSVAEMTPEQVSRKLEELMVWV